MKRLLFVILMCGCMKSTTPKWEPPPFEMDFSNYCVMDGLAFPAWKLKDGNYECIDPHYAKQVVDHEQGGKP
jgi:hypothetical protein